MKWNKISQKKKFGLVLAGVVIIAGAISLNQYRSHPNAHSSGVQKSGSIDKTKKTIQISSEILKNYPLKMSTLTEIKPSEEVLLPGRVQKDPTQVAQVTARAQGRVMDIRVKEADQVQLGQVLATIQSSEVAQAQSIHLKSLMRFELATHQLERSKELFQHEIISAREYEITTMDYKSAKAELEANRIHLQHLGISKEEVTQLEKSPANTGELQIRSPISGWVLERKATLGQSVSAEDALFTVGKTDKVWIVLDVYEKDIPLIDEEMTAEVLVSRGNDEQKVLPAKVARISSVIDSTTRSAKVWLEMNNADQDLKLGQAISARIQGIHQDHAKRVISGLPLDAVHQIEGESIVFVKKSDLIFEARAVKTGWSSDQWIEVKSGVNPGEEIASAGSFILKSEFLRN
jgi:cobalt-zinc-cadmium efflux system membrane fusion protein